MSNNYKYAEKSIKKTLRTYRFQLPISQQETIISF